MSRRKRMVGNLDDDIREHIEIETRENVDNGMTPDEAHYAALRKFGNRALVKEDARAVWIQQWLEHLGQDLRYGMRTLVQTPGLTTVVVLSLALGIGANTAIFSLIDAVMLRMLPVEDPQQLVLLSGNQTKSVQGGPEHSGYGNTSLSYPGFLRLRQNNDVFSSVFGFVPLGFDAESVAVKIDGQPSMAGGEMVSGNYFDGLGVPPLLGRLLTGDDEAHAVQVTVLSFSYWTRRFGRSPSVVGKTIFLGGHPYTIVGVTPPEFFGVEPGRSPDFWVPLAEAPGLTPWGVTAETGQSLFTQKKWWWLMIMGRLKPGVTQTQARAALDVWLRQTLMGDVGMPEVDARTFVMKVDPASHGLDSLRNYFSQPLTILMSVVGLVLLIACSNVAALLLARAQARRREMAVRLALGASRSRLVRQLLTESLMLALAGGAVGLAFAAWGAPLLVALMSGGAPLPVNVRLNLTVVGFAAGVSMLTGLLFGLAPAIGSTRANLSPALKENAAAGFQRRPGSRWGFGKSLVIAQVAFSLLLITGAGLFIRTLMNLEHENLGFDPHGVLLFGVNPRQSGYQGQRLINVYGRLLDRVRAVPGVQRATLSAYTLLSGWVNSGSIAVEDPQTKADEGVFWNVVGPDFLKTMRIQLLLGRDIRVDDTASSPHVVVVNQVLARKYFGSLDPIGRRFTFGQKFNPNDAYQIVGVVKNARFDTMRGDPPMTAYVSFAQAGEPGAMHFEVRTAGDPAAIIPSLRRATQEVDSNLTLSEVKTQNQQIDEALAQQRMFALLSTFFGVLALALAAIGLYGTMTYSVTRKTNEIGIRMALGARASQVLKAVLGEAFALVLVGVAVGLPLAFAVARFVASNLYGLKPSDPLTFAAATVTLLAVAALAAYLPARRASKVDPMVALRNE